VLFQACQFEGSVAIAGEVKRASFAADPSRSRGRLFAEDETANRNAFRRDCDRIVHSTAFRRLKHKTQVFVSSEGDHFRTRLTHTLEVAQIARALARRMGLDEDLTETLALAHDLGHPPFGHAGEDALNDCMKDFGGFDHNAQSLRVVTNLERRYASFDGLNLTWESLEGIAKHNGPLTDREGEPVGRHHGKSIPYVIAEYVKQHDLELWTFASAEAQAAAIADDIAYDAHDLDDAVRAYLVEIDELATLPVAGEIYARVKEKYPAAEGARLINEITRRLIATMINDVVAESSRRIEAARIKTVEDVRNAKGALVGFSPAIAEADRAIKSFLTPRMYKHERVLSTMNNAQQVLHDLFSYYFDHLDALPPGWSENLALNDKLAKARRVADFIAGMTDNFALEEHRRFFDSRLDLR
jgi:dGTPase